MSSIHVTGRPVRLLLMLTLVALGAVNASTASARVPGIELIKATSVYDSTEVRKFADAECPPGKVLLGGAGEVGGNGEVIMDDMSPVPFKNAFTVRGYEDNDGGADYTGNWKVTSYAFCSEPLTGLERRAQSSVSSSADKPVSVACTSPTKILLSASGNVTDALGEVVMEQIEPFGFASSEISAREEDLFDAGWFVTAHAICVDPGGLGFGARVPVSSGYGTGSTHTAVAHCPPGQVLVGAGGNAYATGEAVMDKITPSDDLTTLTVTAHVTDSYSGRWAVNAVATCFTRW
jgi:hypothetical protein